MAFGNERVAAPTSDIDRLDPDAYVQSLTQALKDIGPLSPDQQRDESEKLRLVRQLLWSHKRCEERAGKPHLSAVLEGADGLVTPAWVTAHYLVRQLVYRRAPSARYRQGAGTYDVDKRAADQLLGTLKSGLGTTATSAISLLGGPVGAAFTALGWIGSLVDAPGTSEDKRIAQYINRGLQPFSLTAPPPGVARTTPNGAPATPQQRAAPSAPVVVVHRLNHVHSGTVSYVIRDPLSQQRAAVVRAEAGYSEAHNERDRLRLAAGPHPSENASRALGQAQATLEQRQRQLHQARTALATGALDAAFAAARPRRGEPDYAQRAIAAALPYPVTPSLPPATPRPGIAAAPIQARPLGPPSPAARPDYDGFYRGLVVGLRGY